MAIVSNASSLAGCYFLNDVPDQEWTDMGDWSGHVRLKIFKDGNNVQTLLEPATAVDGKVYLRGLAEVLRSYVPPVQLTETVFTNNAYSETGVPAVMFSACLIDANDIDPHPGTIRQSFVVYALCRTTHDPVNDVMFLTRYRERTIPPEQYVMANFFARSGIKLRERLWFVPEQSVTPQQEYITQHVREFSSSVVMQDSPRLIGMYCCSVRALAALEHYQDVSHLWMVDLELVNSQDEVVDMIRFRLDHQHHAQLTLVGFTNCFGVPEVEAFTGVAERSEILNGEYGWIDDQYKKLSEDITLEHHLNVVINDKDHRSSLHDMATAPHVYVLREEGLVKYEEVTVTAATNTHRKPYTSPSVCSVTLRNCDRVFDTLTRMAWDETYDPDYMGGLYDE